MLSLSRCARYLTPEAQETIDTLMAEHQLGKYEKFFLVHFSAPLRVKRLFTYGVAKLPDEADRPDLDLATYFYLLSEMESLSPEIRDFAMQAMWYCEGESGAPTWSRAALKTEYENIKTLLRKSER